MGMKKLTCFIIAAALMLSVGCSSLDTTNSFNGLKLDSNKTNVSHVTGRVSGLYLLNIPLITGSVSSPGVLAPVIGQDTVALTEVSKMVSGKAKTLGSTELLDVTSSRRSLWIAPLFVLFWETQEVSGNGVTN
jgi:hypothetical protein